MLREDYLNNSFVNAMQKKYYKPGNLFEKSQLMDLSSVAILGIDLQNFFLNSKFKAYLPSSDSLIKKLLEFYKWCKENKIKIILTKHHHKYPSNMAKWWNDEMIQNTEKTEIVESLKYFADIIIEKNTYDAFYKTNLDGILKDNHVDTLIITGVMTHLCCETTARSAFVHGYNVIFPIDGTATQNSKLHECSLQSISHGFGPTPTLRDVIEWIQKLQ